MSDYSFSHFPATSSPPTSVSDDSRPSGENVHEVTVTLEHLDAALVSLLSNNNTTRLEAESYFASLSDDLRLIAALLARMQDPAQTESIQQLATVLLTNKIAAAWPKLTAHEQVLAQRAILDRLANSNSRGILRAVAMLANVVAQSSVLSRPWEELLPAMEQAARSPVETHREAAMTLLGQLTDSLGLRLKVHYPALQALFIAGVLYTYPPSNLFSDFNTRYRLTL
jgi:hypothetical protein